MANPSAIEAIRVPGKLCVAPTDLTTAYPHGGTGLGLMKDFQFLPNATVVMETAEEFGGVPIRGYHGGESPILLAVLRDWDSDALAKLHPQAGTGSSSGEGTIVADVNAAGRAGTEFTAFKLYFSPLDDENPAVYFPAAFAHFDAAARIQLQIGEDAGWACVFVAVPDANGRTVVVALPEDITL